MERAVLPEKEGERHRMSVRGLVTVVIGVVAFVVIDSLITNIKCEVSPVGNSRVNWWLIRGNLQPAY